MTRGHWFSAEVGRRTQEQVNALMKLEFDDAQPEPGRNEEHPDISALNYS